MDDRPNPAQPAPSSRCERVLVLGDPYGLGEALAHRFERLGAHATTVPGGSDSELTEALARPEWTTVAILTHDDALALRLTLLCARVRPELPLWVTLFDKTIVHQVRQIVPNVHVVRTAELAAAELAERCLGCIGDRPPSAIGGIRIVDDALRLMVLAGAGLLGTLIVQTVITMIALHYNLVDSLYFSTRSVATVADVPRAVAAADWFKLISTATTVISVVLVAIFTAALVRRLSRPRLTTLFGSRRPASRGHALLVGFGQIGFRLAQELQRRGVAVVAIERDIDAPCVRLARRAGIPVAIGRGDDREMLELAGVRSCAVVAAVTSDDLANVAVGLAATDLRPAVPLVLRLGDGNVATETESLLHLGHVFDAHDFIAQTIAEQVSGAGDLGRSASIATPPVP